MQSLSFSICFNTFLTDFVIACHKSKRKELSLFGSQVSCWFVVPSSDFEILASCFCFEPKASHLAINSYQSY